ncbi:zinc-dependent metalloprotease [Flagellimonas profundi]|uniref:Zinc-dependent metalloprotease n=1 Tax=Flagellimonas profundi TaxID=2915620 RepID=A0ABS3FCB6_9FLAO|nr:zinc-dependent metalloprotease [Allomuricauda profundi]MBO0340211.1 zinc-dependent metalloprotease [Allomuricauda profundi]
MKYILICAMWVLSLMGTKAATDDGVQSHNGGMGPDAFLKASLVDGQLLMDLPESMLGEPFLWTRTEARYQYGTKQVTFNRYGDEIYLEEHRVWSEAGIWIPLRSDPTLEKVVLAVFPMGEDREAVYRLDVTELFWGDGMGWAHVPDTPKIPSLTKVVDTRYLKDELMVKVQWGLLKNGSKTVQDVYYSFMPLPRPMDPRRFDYRMGYWLEEKGVVRNGTKNDIGNVIKWRLEKKHADRKVSVPIKPIVFLLSPDIPKQWRPYIKAGIEEWLPAFEAAGFKDAIRVMETDSLDEWSAHSLGSSVVRWTGNKNIRTFEERRGGATVATVIDLRSGELIKSDILMGSHYTRYMDEYFIRCAALDSRARTYPFPDELLGELIQSVTAHETGHALGMKDAHYGEYSYPVEKVGNIPWLRKMGHTPSIMTYARHNNLAQPRDSVPPSLLMQQVGPMDSYSIRWAYMEFPKEMSLGARADSLEQLIRLQETVPWYRYNRVQGEIIGPGSTNEVVETNDPVKAARLALENMERNMGLLPLVNRGQKDNVRLERIYREMLELWYDTMGNVLSLVGGYEIFYQALDRPGRMYTPISVESQEEAMDFLTDQAFDPPYWLARPDFGTDIRYSTYPDRLLSYQQYLVLKLLNHKRMMRLEHMEAYEGYEGILKTSLEQLQRGLFKELWEGQDIPSPGKQELQLTYLDWLVKAIGQERQEYEADKKAYSYSDYTKGIMMGRLIALKAVLEKRFRKVEGSEAEGHWTRCLVKLDKLLEEK